MMIDAFAHFFVGLGFFFVGLHLISIHIKELSGRKFKLLLTNWTRNPILTALWGVLSGGITQSSSGSAFILIGLNSSKVISLRKSLSIINWANIGTSIILFFVALNVQIGFFFLIGISGFIWVYGRAYWRKISQILFGIGILFYGLLLLKQHSGMLAESEMVVNAFAYIDQHIVFAFLLGMIMRLIAQSSSTVSVIAITMTAAGLLTTDQVMMVIFGTSFGVALSTFLLSFGFKGVGKQIAMFQVWLNLFIGLLFAVLLLVEMNFEAPLFKALIVELTPDINQQMALVFFGSKFLGGLLIVPFYKPISKRLAKRYTPSSNDEISEMKYLNNHLLEDPDTAVELVRKEQKRVAEIFTSKYVQWAHENDDNEKSQRRKLEDLTEGVESALKDIDRFLREIVDMDIDQELSEKLILTQKVQYNLELLNQSLLEFIKTIKINDLEGDMKRLFLNLLEGIDVILMTLVEALELEDRSEVDVLESISSNNNHLVKQLRENSLKNQKEYDQSQIFLVYANTNGYERIIWIVNNIATTLKQYELWSNSK